MTIGLGPEAHVLAPTLPNGIKAGQTREDDVEGVGLLDGCCLGSCKFERPGGFSHPLKQNALTARVTRPKVITRCFRMFELYQVIFHASGFALIQTDIVHFFNKLTNLFWFYSGMRNEIK
jgi:hypothetical protein